MSYAKPLKGKLLERRDAQGCEDSFTPDRLSSAKGSERRCAVDGSRPRPQPGVSGGRRELYSQVPNLRGEDLCEYQSFVLTIPMMRESSAE